MNVYVHVFNTRDPLKIQKIAFLHRNQKRINNKYQWTL